MYATCLKLGVLAVICTLSAALGCVSSASTRQQGVGRDAEGGRMSGRWEMNVRPGGQTVRLTLLRPGGNRDNLASVHLPVSRLQGWDEAQVQSGAGRAHFQLRRDAGSFTFDGQFAGGKGEGEWTFAGSAAFARELEKRGPGLGAAEELFTLALNDVGLAYLGEMAGAGYGGLSAAQLVALHSNGVRADYVAELRRAGYDGLTLNELLALKTNGVTADFIKRAGERGHRNLPVNRLVSLRVNGTVQ